MIGALRFLLHSTLLQDGRAMREGKPKTQKKKDSNFVPCRCRGDHGRADIVIRVLQWGDFVRAVLKGILPYCPPPPQKKTSGLKFLLRMKANGDWSYTSEKSFQVRLFHYSGDGVFPPTNANATSVDPSIIRVAANSAESFASTMTEVFRTELSQTVAIRRMWFTSYAAPFGEWQILFESGAPQAGNPQTFAALESRLSLLVETFPRRVTSLISCLPRASLPDIDSGGVLSIETTEGSTLRLGCVVSCLDDFVREVSKVVHFTVHRQCLLYVSPQRTKKEAEDVPLSSSFCKPLENISQLADFCYIIVVPQSPDTSETRISLPSMLPVRFHPQLVSNTEAEFFARVSAGAPSESVYAQENEVVREQRPTQAEEAINRLRELDPRKLPLTRSLRTPPYVECIAEKREEIEDDNEDAGSGQQAREALALQLRSSDTSTCVPSVLPRSAISNDSPPRMAIDVQRSIMIERTMKGEKPYTSRAALSPLVPPCSAVQKVTGTFSRAVERKHLIHIVMRWLLQHPRKDHFSSSVLVLLTSNIVEAFQASFASNLLPVRFPLTRPDEEALKKVINNHVETEILSGREPFRLEQDRRRQERDRQLRPAFEEQDFDDTARAFLSPGRSRFPNEHVAFLDSPFDMLADASPLTHRQPNAAPVRKPTVVLTRPVYDARRERLSLFASCDTDILSLTSEAQAAPGLSKAAAPAPFEWRIRLHAADERTVPLRVRANVADRVPMGVLQATGVVTTAVLSHVVPISLVLEVDLRRAYNVGKDGVPRGVFSPGEKYSVTILVRSRDGIVEQATQTFEMPRLQT